MRSHLIECVVNYEYADGKFADASVDWKRDDPRTLRFEWQEPGYYCSMNPDCNLSEDSSDEDVLTEIEKYGDVSDVTIWEGCEE